MKKVLIVLSMGITFLLQACTLLGFQKLEKKSKPPVAVWRVDFLKKEFYRKLEGNNYEVVNSKKAESKDFVCFYNDDFPRLLEVMRCEGPR